jgi:hypothetical protein
VALKLALGVAVLGLHKKKDEFLIDCRVWMEHVFYFIGDGDGLTNIKLDVAGDTSHITGKMGHVAITMVVRFNPDPCIDIQYANGASKGTISFHSQPNFDTQQTVSLDSIREMMFDTTADLSTLVV